MPFEWAEYLDLAKRLSRDDGGEAEFRTAISRAYYAVFCKARNRLIANGSSIPKDALAHEQVWREYRAAASNIMNNIGINGDRLRKKRKTADYDDQITRVKEETELAISTADNVLWQLDQLNSR